MAPPLFRKLLLGSSVTMLAALVNAAAALIVMPHLIAALGDQWYGLWVMLGAVVSYFLALDLGVFAAAERHVSAAFAKKDWAGANETLSTCIALYSAAGLVAGLLLAGAAALAPLLLDDPLLARAARWALLILGADTALFFILGAFNGVIVGKMRYDAAGWLSIAKAVLRAGLILTLVNRAPGLVALAAIAFSTNLAERAARLILAARLFPEMRLAVSKISSARARALFGFGAKSFLIEAGERARRQADILILGAFAGAAAVTPYNIARRLAGYLAQILGSALEVTLPLFAGHDARAARGALARDFSLASRLAALLAALSLGGAALLAEPVIAAWIGPDYAFASLYFYILAPALAFELAATPIRTLMAAQNRHGALAALEWIEALAMIGLSAALAPKYGAVGVAVGTAAPMALARGIGAPLLAAGAAGQPAFRVISRSSGFVIAAALAQAPIFWIAIRADWPGDGLAGRLLLAAPAYGALAIIAGAIAFSAPERRILWRALGLMRGA